MAKVEGDQVDVVATASGIGFGRSPASRRYIWSAKFRIAVHHRTASSIVRCSGSFVEGGLDRLVDTVGECLQREPRMTTVDLSKVDPVDETLLETIAFVGGRVFSAGSSFQLMDRPDSRR